MATRRIAQPTTLVCTVRVDQGYRYLDRCGQALIRLENELDEGWIPGEISPQRGNIQNYRLGLSAVFSSELMSVNQTEFISFDHFRDQTCRLYEILRTTLEISTIVTPAVKITLQTGFDQPEEAENYIRKLALSDFPHFSL
jgi:hypothetical protein